MCLFSLGKSCASVLSHRAVRGNTKCLAADRQYLTLSSMESPLIEISCSVMSFPVSPPPPSQVQTGPICCVFVPAWCPDWVTASGLGPSQPPLLFSCMLGGQCGEPAWSVWDRVWSTGPTGLSPCSGQSVPIWARWSGRTRAVGDTVPLMEEPGVGLFQRGTVYKEDSDRVWKVRKLDI